MNQSLPRFIRHHRRPASSRCQVRQHIATLRDLYQLERALDQLHNDFLSEVVCSIEEQL
jgi:hypothetical protein